MQNANSKHKPKIKNLKTATLNPTTRVWNQVFGKYPLHLFPHNLGSSYRYLSV
jgi:hypothetical protein